MEFPRPSRVSTSSSRAVRASGSFLLPGTVTLGAVFSARSTMPFSAIAGVDLNGDAAITDYVPGTTRNVFNRGNNTQSLALVNAYRATTGLAPSGVRFDGHSSRRSGCFSNPLHSHLLRFFSDQRVAQAIEVVDRQLAEYRLRFV